MQLELTEQEADLLREVLESVVGDLSPEIADTDNPFYRRDLIARREQLRSILGKVGGTSPRPA